MAGLVEKFRRSVYDDAAAGGVGADQLERATTAQSGAANRWAQGAGLPGLGAASTGAHTDYDIQRFIYDNAQREGLSARQLDEAFGLSPGVAANWVVRNRLRPLPNTPGSRQLDPARMGGPPTGQPADPAAGSTPTPDAAVGPSPQAALASVYGGPLSYSSDWAGDDPYLQSVAAAGWQRLPDGTYVPRLQEAPGAQAAAAAIDRILAGEEAKARAIGTPEAMQQFEAKAAEARGVFNNQNYRSAVADSAAQPLADYQRIQAANNARAFLRGIDPGGGLQVGGIDLSGAPTMDQLAGVDDGTRMSDAEIQGILARRVAAAPAASSGLPTPGVQPVDFSSPESVKRLENAINDYRLHSGFAAKQAGASGPGVAPPDAYDVDLGRYTKFLQSGRAAASSDLGKLASTGNMNAGLINQAISDYAAPRMAQITAKGRPLEAAGPAAGSGVVKVDAPDPPGRLGEIPGQKKPEAVAPLQTPTLARKVRM